MAHRGTSIWHTAVYSVESTRWEKKCQCDVGVTSSSYITLTSRWVHGFDIGVMYALTLIAHESDIRNNCRYYTYPEKRGERQLPIYACSENRHSSLPRALPKKSIWDRPTIRMHQTYGVFLRFCGFSALKSTPNARSPPFLDGKCFRLSGSFRLDKPCL